MKTLHGFDDPVVNEEIGSLDYSVDDKGKKILRVLMEGEKQIKYTQIVRQTLEETESSEIDEVYIIANKLTSGAREIITNDDALSYITPMIVNPFSMDELLFVINKKELCEEVCGLKRDVHHCKGLLDNDHKCLIKQIAQNTVFHESMNWVELLREDLNRLIFYQNSVKLEVVV